MSQRALNLFEEFHGDSAKIIGKRKLPSDFDTLVVLGKAVSVTYESDKWNGGGDGTKAYYEHKMPKGNLLCCTEDGKMLVIIGKNLRVEDRGIVN